MFVARRRMRPAAAVMPSVCRTPRFRRNRQTAASNARPSAARSTLAGTGNNDRQRPGANRLAGPETSPARRTRPRGCRSRPTTPAVMAAKAPESDRFDCKRSMNGAPRKTKVKHGAKVTQSVSIEPAMPPVMPDTGPGERYPARKPTNCSTRISGPGVVSARPRPASISCGDSQWYASTASCAT